MEITIDGRKFSLIMNGTFEHDIWMSQEIRKAGLASLQPLPEETEEQFIERIAQSAYESGAGLKILGGLFMPEGMDVRSWSEELAASTSSFFGKAVAPEDKRILRTQIASALFYFFVDALASSQTSRKSSPPMEADERHETEEVSAMGTGDTSSENYQDTTQTEQK